LSVRTLSGSAAEQSAHHAAEESTGAANRSAVAVTAELARCTSRRSLRSNPIEKRCDGAAAVKEPDRFHNVSWITFIALNLS
jgi:hypothetical protein